MRWLIGLAIGVGIGFLFAPVSGSELRRKIRRGAAETVDRVRLKGRHKAGEIGRVAAQEAYDRTVGKYARINTGT